MNLPSKDGCPQLIVAAVRMNAQFDRWAPLRWAWGTGASAHGDLLNSPSAFEQFHFVEKIPARISRGCYAARIPPALVGREMAGPCGRRREQSKARALAASSAPLFGNAAHRDAVRSFAEVAGFLYRDEDEVRQNSKALGLKTGPRHGERLRAVPNVERLDEQRAHDLKNRGARSRGSRHRRTMAAPSTAGFQTSEMNTEA